MSQPIGPLAAGLAAGPPFSAIRPTVDAALRWLYDTEQPDDAMLQHTGVFLPPVAGRRYWAIPRGWAGYAVLAVEVTEPRWDAHAGRYTNPLGERELETLGAELEALGHPIVASWNGHPSETGSIALRRKAHPSLIAAVTRYQAGCTEHPGRGVFCQRCDWFTHGNARLVQPTPPGDAPP